SSEVEAGLAGRVGEGLDLAVIGEAAAVEDDRLDAGSLGLFGDGFADLRSGFLARALGRRPLLERRGRGDRPSGGVVDDLGVDVLIGKVDGETRTLRGAGDFLPDAT